MNKYAALIISFYGIILFTLAASISLNIGLAGGAYHYSLETLPFILLLIVLSIYCSYKLCPNKTQIERIFFSGCTLLILLLPFGDLFVYLLPFILVLYLIIQRKNIKNIFTFAEPPAKIWGTFLGVCFITSFFARSQSSALAMTAALVGYGLIFCLGRTFELSQDENNFLSDLFTGIMSITICFVFFHLGIKKPIVLLGIPFSADASAASFISNWAANAAGFLIISFTLIFGRLLRFVREKKPAQITFTGIALLLIFIGILSTQTRMVFFFFTFMGFLFLIFYPWAFLRKTRFLIILLPFFLVPLLAKYSDKWKNTLQNPMEQISFIDRLNQFEYGIQLLKDGHFLQGVGLFNFRLYYNENILASGKNLPLVQFLHNMYLSIFTETGVLGGILFLVLICSMFYQYTKLRHQSLSYLGMLFFGGIIGYNITDNWLFVLKFSLLSFFLLGIFYPKKACKHE